MDDEIYEKYKLAGRIAAEARDFGFKIIKPEISLLEVAEKVEEKIIKNGAKLAFPVNISIDNIAAHYSPTHKDLLKFKKGDLVKLDVGAHVDGYIADTAITKEVNDNQYEDMIKAASEGLDKAIEILKPGVDLSKLGSEVERTISSYGYKAIDNLTGHKLDRYILHSGMSVPSVSEILNNSKPKIDDVLAVEPFATNGKGHVIAGDGSNIFLCIRTIKSKIIRDKKLKMMHYKFFKQFGTLPFAQRWAIKHFGESGEIILRKLSYLGLIKHYPQLLEQKNGMVTQKEHTVIITENGCEVTT